MKLSEILVSKVDKPWTETLEKTFLSEMAHGTLDPMKFRNFMLQDYMYLLDYIELLKDIKSLAENEELKDFLACVISDTENETYRVHIPAMKELGISDEDISGGINEIHAGGRRNPCRTYCHAAVFMELCPYRTGFI